MSFGGDVALVRELLDRRRAIIEHIESSALNARGKGELPALPRELSRLHEQLAEAHLAGSARTFW